MSDVCGIYLLLYVAETERERERPDRRPADAVATRKQQAIIDWAGVVAVLVRVRISFIFSPFRVSVLIVFFVASKNTPTLRQQATSCTTIIITAVLMVFQKGTKLPAPFGTRRHGSRCVSACAAVAAYFLCGIFVRSLQSVVSHRRKRTATGAEFLGLSILPASF